MDWMIPLALTLALIAAPAVIVMFMPVSWARKLLIVVVMYPMLFGLRAAFDWIEGRGWPTWPVALAMLVLMGLGALDYRRKRYRGR